MCGICGVAGRALAEHELPEARAMRDVLTHRGPDGLGETALESPSGAAAWLGHRRLKIIDLTANAHQPMVSDDGRVGLTYNGEVYNFRELRRELEARGHRFRSTGDTEVVLRAYLEWDEEFVSRIDGMFALAIWDGRRSRLLLARDRTGKKPLYYSVGDGRMTFASEIKGLLEASWVRTEPAPARVADYLTYGYVPHPWTFFEGVLQVPPATVVTYDPDGTLRSRLYWDPLPEQLDGASGTLDTDVAELLAHATERRIVADVPVGLLLSGGIDSSLVLALMSRVVEGPVRTFSIGFSDDATYDERHWARLVADRFGADHTEFVVQADAAILMDRLLWHHDQPYHDSSALPTYCVCRLAGQEVTVALNGDGGDEVFAGYDRFRAAAIAQRLPSGVARAGRAAAGLLPRDDGYYSRSRRARRFFEAAEAPPHDRYQGGSRS